jgi:hypothetical protein
MKTSTKVFIALAAGLLTIVCWPLTVVIAAILVISWTPATV